MEDCHDIRLDGAGPRVAEPTPGLSVRGRYSGGGGHTAAHGSLALKKLQTRAYDLILRDLRMPECDGPALYHELQPKPEPEEKLCHP